MIAAKALKPSIALAVVLLVQSPAWGQAQKPARNQPQPQKIIYGWLKNTFVDLAGRCNKTGVEIFLFVGMNPNARNTEGRTALVLAAREDCAAVVEILLANGADANLASRQKGLESGKTALMFAAQTGREEIARRLLNRAALVNATTYYGKTALMFAAEAGHTNVVKILLSQGAAVHLATWHGWTALLLAADDGRALAVEALLQNGAKVNERLGGRTPLMLAATQGHLETVRVLLAHGANLKAKVYGATALSMALKKGHNDIVELLRKSEAKE